MRLLTFFDYYECASRIFKYLKKIKTSRSYLESSPSMTFMEREGVQFSKFSWIWGSSDFSLEPYIILSLIFILTNPFRSYLLQSEWWFVFCLFTPYLSARFDNWHTHDFGYAYVNAFAHFFPMIFKSFQNFSGSYNFILFKNLLLYIWTLIHLIVLGRDKFFTIYICFKETFFFIQTF